MVFFDDIYFQICDRFITKEQRNRHFHSNRHLYRQVNGYTPAFFPQRKLIRDEGMQPKELFGR